MNKHTPGPHEVIGTTVYALEFDSWRKGVEQMRNRIYANVQGYKDTPKEELEATARLYAAAPDLLEALRQMISLFEASIPDRCNPDFYEEWIFAQAAIAKATGESK